MSHGRPGPLALAPGSALSELAHRNRPSTKPTGFGVACHASPNTQPARMMDARSPRQPDRHSKPTESAPAAGTLRTETKKWHPKPARAATSRRDPSRLYRLRSLRDKPDCNGGT